jgi:outer membrane lipoprotein SlyB
MSETRDAQSPIVRIAAVAVIILAAVGIGVMTGLIPSSYSKGGAPQAKPVCGNCGVVESVQPIEAKDEGSGAGAVAGGEIGAGRGKSQAPAAPAAGGAYAGGEIEKNMNKTINYRISIRMNDGSVLALTQSADPGVHAGDSVQVANGSVLKR